VLTVPGTARNLHSLYVLAVKSLLCCVGCHTDLVVGPRAPSAIAGCQTGISCVVADTSTCRPPSINASIYQSSRVRPIPCRCPIPDTIGRSCTDTDTRPYNFFVLKMRFCVEYKCVQVIYVCGVYARKYCIGLKLQECVATVLTVETGKRTTGLLVSAPILK